MPSSDAYLADLAGVRIVLNDGSELQAAKFLDVKTGLLAAYNAATRRIDLSCTIAGANAATITVRAATTGNITLSGEQTVDAVACISEDRVLVKNQSSGAQNGVYVVAGGAWSRATDFDSSDEAVPMKLVGVSEGSANGNRLFALTTDAPITLDTTPLTFSDITGSGTQTLSQTLVQGNTTGALPILVDNSQYVRLGSTSPAGTGLLRLRRNQGGLKWRNGDNTADIGLELDGSDILDIGVATAGGSAETRLRSESLLTGFILGTELYRFSRPGADTGRFAFASVGSSAGCYLTVEDTTTAAAGRNLTLRAGKGGTGNQNGGDTIVQPGDNTGSGVDGSAGIKDVAGTWRVKLTPTQELEYNAATNHMFATAGLALVTIAEFGDTAIIIANGDNNPTGLLITIDAPTTGAAGRTVAMVGGGGGTGNQNGGDAYVQVGIKTGSGTDGSAGIKDSAAAYRVKVDGSTNNVEANGATAVTLKIAGTAKATLGASSLVLGAIYQEFADTSAPGTPTAAHRVWSESGALKGKGSSGTITTIAAAEPHCPRCGKDAANEWQNPDQEWKISLCMWCATAPGGPLAGCVIERTGT